MQPLLTGATPMFCPHGGRLAVVGAGPRVFASGAPILTVDAVAAVEACPVPPPGPCVTARWSAGSMRVLIDGRPVLMAGSPGSCRSASEAPTGPIGIGAGDTRVFGI